MRPVGMAYAVVYLVWTAEDGVARFQRINSVVDHKADVAVDQVVELKIIVDVDRIIQLTVRSGVTVSDVVLDLDVVA